MPWVEAVAVLVAALGWLTFCAMMLRSIRLTYVIYAQWQLIGPETEAELRRQGMPYSDGLTDAWWEQIAPFTPYERIARELATKNVRTDNALANVIRRYQQARRISTVALFSALVALAMLVIGHR